MSAASSDRRAYGAQDASAAVRPPPHTPPGSIRAQLRQPKLLNRIVVLLILISLGAGLFTYAALSQGPSLQANDLQQVLWLLRVDLAILLLLGAVLAYRVGQLWRYRRRGLAGSRLHLRLAMLFSLMAMGPTLIIGTFSLVFLHLGVDSWFSARVGTAVTDAEAVAQAYLQEHQRSIQADALYMANDLNRQAPGLMGNQEKLSQAVKTQALLRDLTEALVFDGTGLVLARGGLTFSMELERIPEEMFDRARSGEVAVLNARDDRVRALVRLDRFVDAYLYVGRFVDPQVTSYITRAEEAVAQYRALEGSRASVQTTFTLIFGLVGLLLVLAAIGTGLVLASSMAERLSAMIGAAERVRVGDLSPRLVEGDGADDIDRLSRAFNRMIDQLATQRQEVTDATRILDQRRRFTEAVLAGVSAGVLSIGRDGTITAVNASAQRLLQLDEASVEGRAVQDVLPEVEGLMASHQAQSTRGEQREIGHRLADGSLRRLLVRVTAPADAEEDRALIITFDDITNLVEAQRKAAWADVARRIAHEIKNPLTPIQLSAERLQRRYSRQITEDSETFSACIETIIRRVEDIGRMVAEFSSFARMPKAVMREEVLPPMMQSLLSLYREAHPHIRFELAVLEEPGMVRCDRSLVSQAVTNLIENSLNALAEAQEGLPLDDGNPFIRVEIRRTEVGVGITVSDNGCGLPDIDPQRLQEPYVTTRSKGTGLGLAIVAKIADDHGGRLRLARRAPRGTQVTLDLPQGVPPRGDTEDKQAAA